MWSYIFHRISGVALAVYLVMHIWIMHYIQKGPTFYDSLMRTLDKPFFRLGEIALLAGILYHSLNGLRLCVMDMGVGMRSHRITFWIVFAVSGILTAVGGMALLFAK